MTSTWSTVLSAALALALSGCGLVVDGEELGQVCGVEDDLREYEELVAALDDDRELALDESAQTIRTSGPWLAWVEGQTLGLRRYPDRYELSLPAPELGYSLAESLVLMTAPGELGVVVRGYALPDGELVDEQELAVADDAPTGVLDDIVFVADAGQLWRWQVGGEAPAVLGTLADAGIAAELTQLEAVATELGDHLILVAGAQLWSLELSNFTATAIAELDTLLDVGPRGVLFTRGDALLFHELDGETRSLDAEISASGWSLNPTFASIHEYAGGGASLADDRVVYIGRAGVFGYALDEQGPDAITPILIEPRWDVGAGIPRIEYREPLVVGTTVLARALIGESGEVGDSGPIFATPLNPAAFHPAGCDGR